MLVLIIYLMGLLGPINVVLGLACAAATVIFGARFIVTIVEDGDDEEVKFLKMSNGVGYILTALTVLLVLLPSKDTAYGMLAAYGITEAYEVASESDEVRSLANKSLLVLDKAMSDYISNDDSLNSEEN